jgi:High potential iron-sulfur protein
MSKNDSHFTRRTERANGLAKISRRTLFTHIALMGAGLAGLMAMALPAYAKMKQTAAGYQDQPKGDQSCSNCNLFSAPSSCTLVDGTINPQGWCRFHQTKN